jgi:hypothetical protein
MVVVQLLVLQSMPSKKSACHTIIKGKQFQHKLYSTPIVWKHVTPPTIYGAFFLTLLQFARVGRNSDYTLT